MEQDQSAHHWERVAKAAELRVQQLQLAIEHAKIHEETSRDLETGLSIGEKEALLANQVRGGKALDWQSRAEHRCGGCRTGCS